MPYNAPKTYNVQNPLHFNYPKAPFLRGSQYSTYPKFKQQSINNAQQSLNNQNQNTKEKDINLELTKVLEKEIAELHTLTEQAKKLAENKKKEAIKYNLKGQSKLKNNVYI